MSCLLLPLRFSFPLALAQVYEQQMFSLCLKWIFFHKPLAGVLTLYNWCGLDIVLLFFLFFHSFAFKRHRAPSLTSCSFKFFFFLSCSFKTHFKEILQIWIKVICNAVGFLSEGTKYDKAMRKATMAAFVLNSDCAQTPSRLRFPLLDKTTLKMLTSWFILGSLNPSILCTFLL